MANNPNNNTANWIGFYKLVDDETLMDMLSRYIVYIVALTGYNLILLHQQRKRYVKSHGFVQKYAVNLSRSDYITDSSMANQLRDPKCSLSELLERMLTKTLHI